MNQTDSTLPTSPPSAAAAAAAPKRQLTLFDSTCIIVGIIIGAGIYETTPLIASNVPGPLGLIGVWVLGGVLSLVGALCYVELANMYPEQGGDYVYLNRAFGRPVGFVFAWAQLWVVRPGSIGAMAFIFARYANVLWPLDQWMPALGGAESTQVARIVYAVAAVAVLSAINVLGVPMGKWTQNLLTTVKVLGLGAVVVVGQLFASPPVPPVPAAPRTGSLDFGLAMIFVLFAYGGWNEMAYVGAEVRDPRRNILRALLLGTVAVGVCYILISLAFLNSLGFEGVCNPQKGVAADVLRQGLGDWAQRAISLLICISALGAINGQIFTGARIYYAMGKEHQLFARLGRWSPRLGTPVWSLLIQAVITLALVVGFGLAKSGKDPNATGFDSMVIFTTPVFWIFMVLVGLSLFQLRDLVPNAARPYRVFFYPFTPFILCVSSLFMAYRGVMWAYNQRSYEAYWAIGLVVVGLLMCIYDPKPTAEPPRPNEPSG